jgi:hypothetical protein
MSLDGDREPRPFVATDRSEINGVVSPDGRWIAYTSRGLGRPEVYVQGFPDGGERHQISTGGGWQPLWSPDGRKIYWITRKRLMMAQVSTAPDFRSGVPRSLFKGVFAQALWTNSCNYDIAPDGESLVMIKPDRGWGRTTEIRVVLNWFEELKRLAPQ